MSRNPILLTYSGSDGKVNGRVSGQVEAADCGRCESAWERAEASDCSGVSSGICRQSPGLTDLFTVATLAPSGLRCRL
jgi:hypothetical protein